MLRSTEMIQYVLVDVMISCLVPLLQQQSMVYCKTQNVLYDFHH